MTDRAQYTAITRGIAVSVEPTYLEANSSPGNSQYVWAYQVTIERLDDQLCPTEPSSQRVICKHSYELTTVTLAEAGFDDEEISDVIRVMSRNGGHCDCEILYNVAEESRLKSRYWNSRVAKSE